MTDIMSLSGFPRADGRKGIRNVVVVAYLVECAHHVAREIADSFRDADVHLVGFPGCYPNPYAREMLERLCTHPNVGAALLVSLGCEGFEGGTCTAGVLVFGRGMKVGTDEHGRDTALRLGGRMIDVRVRVCQRYFCDCLTGIVRIVSSGHTLLRLSRHGQPCASRERPQRIVGVSRKGRDGSTVGSWWMWTSASASRNGSADQRERSEQRQPERSASAGAQRQARRPAGPAACGHPPPAPAARGGAGGAWPGRPAGSENRLNPYIPPPPHPHSGRVPPRWPARPAVPPAGCPRKGRSRRV